MLESLTTIVHFDHEMSEIEYQYFTRQYENHRRLTVSVPGMSPNSKEGQQLQEASSSTLRM